MQFLAGRKAECLRRGIYAGVSAQLLLGCALAAQTPASSSPAPVPRTTHSAAQPVTHPAVHPSSRTHRKPSPAKTIAQTAPPPAPVAVAPAIIPPLPNWPVNDKPAEANVVWDSQGLLVQASNSSLDQILKDIALKTGAQVEGMGQDERIFGTYGPGQAREVLAQLLDGTGYNVLMVGDQGAGTPRRIVLSGRPSGPAPSPGISNPMANNDNEQENEQVEPVLPPSIPPPGPPANMPVRTPQQMQQLMEERQRQMQQALPPNPQD